MENKILDYLVRLVTTTGPWLSKKWLWVLPVIGTLFVILLLLFGLIPTIPEQPNKITIQYWKLGSLLGFPVFLDVIWLVSTQWYLRKGAGVKIGIAYEGYKVDVSDWKRTRAILSDLFKREQIRNRVLLRFVPLRATEVEAVGNQFMTRYKFTVLAAIEQSIAPNKSSPVNSFHIRINTSMNAATFLQKTLHNSLAIHAGRSQKKDVSLADMLKKQALNLHDMLLLFVATHYYVIGNYDDASVLLRHIDNSLARDFLSSKPPRYHIRELDALSCIAQLQFPITKIPLPDELERRLLFAERAMPYFDDFAIVYIAISRAKFLLGKPEEAFALTERFHERIIELQKQGVSINKGAMSKSHLNAGFLFFVREQWAESYEQFSLLLKLFEANKDDWKELVEFSDYVNEMEQFEGIPFLQVLYRKIAGQKAPESMFDSAEKWVNVDKSRSVLTRLFKEIPKPPKNKPVSSSTKRKIKKRRTRTIP